MCVLKTSTSSRVQVGVVARFTTGGCIVAAFIRLLDFECCEMDAAAPAAGLVASS